MLVALGLRTSNISDAALFRLIEDKHPTLLFDEIDAVFHPKSNREELRSLLNSGYRRGLVAHRCVGEGTRMTVKEFDPFGPKVLAGIGNLPDTVADRAFPIRLRRKSRAERVERFRIRLVREEAQPLHDALLRWSQEAVGLADATPALPHEAAEGGSRFGSSSMEDLRFALTVLSLHAEDRLDELDLCWGSDTDEYLRWDSDTDEATGWAIRTLIGLTHPAP